MAKKKTKAKTKTKTKAKAKAKVKAKEKAKVKAKGKAGDRAKARTKAEKKAQKEIKRQKKAARKAVKRGIPKGYHTVQVYLCVDGARQAIDFYKAAFGAETKEALFGPDGKVMHAEVVIGDSVIMIGDVRPEMGAAATKVQFYLYVPDCDALYAQALTAGATPKSEPADMFWGDRFGTVEDPFGNIWSLATQKEALSPEELQRRAEEFMSSMPPPGDGSPGAGPAPEAIGAPQLSAS